MLPCMGYSTCTFVCRYVWPLMVIPQFFSAFGHTVVDFQRSLFCLFMDGWMCVLSRVI